MGTYVVIESRRNVPGPSVVRSRGGSDGEGALIFPIRPTRGISPRPPPAQRCDGITRLRIRPSADMPSGFSLQDMVDLAIAPALGDEARQVTGDRRRKVQLTSLPLLSLGIPSRRVDEGEGWASAIIRTRSVRRTRHESSRADLRRRAAGGSLVTVCCAGTPPHPESTGRIPRPAPYIRPHSRSSVQFAWSGSQVSCGASARAGCPRVVVLAVMCWALHHASWDPPASSSYHVGGDA